MGRDRLKKNLRAELERERRRGLRGLASATNVDSLREHIKMLAGYKNLGEGALSARRRHVDALQRAADHFETGRKALSESRAGEIFAEELRMAQQSLGEITGAVSSDDLLGRIFADFCIGK